MSTPALQSWWRAVEHASFLLRDDALAYWHRDVERRYRTQATDQDIRRLLDPGQWAKRMTRAASWLRPDQQAATDALSSMWTLDRVLGSLQQEAITDPATQLDPALDELEKLFKHIGRIKTPEISVNFEKRIDNYSKLSILGCPTLGTAQELRKLWQRASTYLNADPARFSESIMDIARQICTYFQLSLIPSERDFTIHDKLFMTMLDASSILDEGDIVPLFFLKGKELQPDDLGDLYHALSQTEGQIAFLILLTQGDSPTRRYESLAGSGVLVLDYRHILALLGSKEPGRELQKEVLTKVLSTNPSLSRLALLFPQHGFDIERISGEEFILLPQGPDHPQARYGSMYTRLITDHRSTGDDFAAVCESARKHYGDDLSRRVAIVFSDHGPAPGARYRLYEIRQAEGLAIVPLDSSLFGQIKSGRVLTDILSSEIDQATGQQNLFSISTPVSSDLSFFGRERILQEVVDLLDANQPVGIFGLRKVGKTSLVERLQAQLAFRRLIAYVDTQGTNREQGVWPFYPAIIASFAEHMRHYRPGVTLPELRLSSLSNPSSPSITDDFMGDLRALSSSLGQVVDRERLLLIIDEVDRLLPSGQAHGYEGFDVFFGQLRAANQSEKLLDFIVVGVDPALNRIERLYDRENELYRTLREVWMPSMEMKDVKEMIESLGSQMGVRYEPGALDLLASAGGGQPFITRQMCGITVKDRLGKGEIVVDTQQAQTAIEDFVCDPYLSDPYLSELWSNRIDSTQKEMLCAMARRTDPIPRASLIPKTRRQTALAALKRLEEYALVRKEENAYTIAWDVLRGWIRWVELGLED